MTTNKFQSNGSQGGLETSQVRSSKLDYSERRYGQGQKQGNL